MEADLTGEKIFRWNKETNSTVEPINMVNNLHLHQVAHIALWSPTGHENLDILMGRPYWSKLSDVLTDLLQLHLEWRYNFNNIEHESVCKLLTMER